MSPNPPEVASLVLDIPDDCRMRGEFIELPHLDDELSIRVVLGNSGDTVQVQFARAALKRLVGLAVDPLAVAHRNDDPDYRSPVLAAGPAT
jgi:hypothetical protein